MPITIDVLDETHARIVLDLLTNDGNQPVYNNYAPDNVAPPYLYVFSHVWWPGNGSDGQNFDMVTNQCMTRAYVHCVGETDEAARALSNRVRQLLVNVKPVIAGRSCSLIQQESSNTPDKDERSGVLVMDAVASYLFSSNG